MVLGASWDPTGRYSTMEPSVSTFKGLLKLSEVGLAVKKGENGVKNQTFFFALKMYNMCSKLIKKFTSMENPVDMCPKTHREQILSQLFPVKRRHFSLLFVTVCVQMAATNFVKQLRGVHWNRWLDTCIEECLALVSPAQVLNILRNCQNAPQGQKIIKWSKTW